MQLDFFIFLIPIQLTYCAILVSSAQYNDSANSLISLTGVYVSTHPGSILKVTTFFALP